MDINERSVAYSDGAVRVRGGREKWKDFEGQRRRSKPGLGLGLGLTAVAPITLNLTGALMAVYPWSIAENPCRSKA